MFTSNGDCNQEQKAPMVFQRKMLRALPHFSYQEKVQCSRYATALRARRWRISGSISGLFSSRKHADRIWCLGGYQMVSHLHLVPSLRMSGAISPLPHMRSWRAQGQLCFTTSTYFAVIHPYM